MEALRELAAQRPQRLRTGRPVSTPSAITSIESAWAILHDRRGDRGGALVAAERLDEGAVDLEAVDRQPREVGERGVAGAEVVQHEADAERARRLIVSRDAVRLASQHRLGDLQAQARRLEARCGERDARLCASRSRCVNWRTERFTEMPSGRRVGVRGVPARRLRAGGVEHPAADRVDQPALLGDRDELGRVDQARASGCSQRSSASTETSAPSASETIGW